MTLMVNARHLFYGISMVERYKDTKPYKPYLIFALTDETYSLVCSGDVPEGMEEKKYFFLVSLLDQIYWVFGSVLGSVLGSVMNINTEGIDFSMTALFLVVFTEQWKSTKDHRSAITGVAASVFCLLVFGPSLVPDPVDDLDHGDPDSDAREKENESVREQHDSDTLLKNLHMKERKL